jgi:hypothetical protein
MKATTAGLIGLGIVLFLLSGLWTTIFNGRSTWTDEKARRLGEIRNRMSTLGFLIDQPVIPGNEQSAQNKAAVMKEVEELRTERTALALDYSSAHDTPILVAQILKWSGISVALVGIVGWYAVAQKR